MHQLWPPVSATALPPVTFEDFGHIYAFPTSDRPFVRVNFVTSANAIAAVDGVSAGLSFAADRFLFVLLRELADVILVGAGTARAEKYRGARSTRKLRALRRERGQGRVPPIAVVTASAAIDPEGPLFSDTLVPPLILTTKSAPTNRVSALVAAGADVELAGDTVVTIPGILRALEDRGLRRVVCEGGSRLFGKLIEHDAVDELCLSLANVLVGGSTTVTLGQPTPILPLNLRSVIASEDGLLCQYRRLYEPRR